MIILAQLFWLFHDYLMFICSQFFLIIFIIWWLFVLNYFDYLMIIWFPRQQQVVRQASFPKAFARHRGTFWWWQPVPVGISNYYPLSLAGFDLPSALPHSARSVFLREVADPAVTQYLIFARLGIIFAKSSTHVLSGMLLSTLTWNNENKYNHCNNHNNQ